MGLYSHSRQNHRGAGKKTRKLGKWKTGYYGDGLNPKYVAKRRKSRKAARRARMVTRRRCS